MQKVTIFEALLDTLSFYRNFLHYMVLICCYLLLYKFQSQTVHHHADA